MINKLFELIKYLNRQRNLKVKPFKMAIKLAILNHKKKNRTELKLDEYKTVAILMNDQGIGDVIVSSYLIQMLRENGFKVYVVAEKRIAFLFDEFIAVDKVFLYDRKKGIKNFKQQLKTETVHVAIDLVDKGNNSVRRSQILVALNPLHTIGFNQEKYKLYDTAIPYLEYTSHISNRSIKVLQVMNIAPSIIKYHVNIPLDVKLSVQEFLHSKIDNNKSIIIFNPYGSNEARSFSDLQIETILSFLSLYENCVTIVVGEKNKISHIKERENIVINPLSSFFATVALVECSDLVVTVDTSIVHIASIYNKRMIGIYNNRIIDDKFINNYVWGPNYSNAVQLFTNENLGTGLGDPIFNLDPAIVLEQLELELEKFQL